MSVLIIFIIVQLLGSAYSFRCGRMISAHRKSIHMSEAANDNHSLKSEWQELIDIILEAIPTALRTSDKEIDPDRVIPNPPKFYKASTIGHFNKANKGDHDWDWPIHDAVKDLKNKFNAKPANNGPIDLKSEKKTFIDLLVNHNLI